MNKLKQIYMELDKNIIIIGGILIIIGLLIFLLYLNYQPLKVINECEPLIEEVNTVEDIKATTFYVDIKGEVKKPGVYAVNEEMIINDLIKLAGGLNKNATTKNINLSKKLTSEMLVLINNKKELEVKEIKCNCPSDVEIKETDEIVVPEIVESKISLNNATKEELMSLSGIGESKANDIIEYRSNSSFTKIEDIMNVSGIGESIFVKIKENITL